MQLHVISLQASVMIVVIVMIRALGVHRLPKWGLQALWGAALIRLLYPFRIEFHLSVYNAVQWLNRTFPKPLPANVAPAPVDAGLVAVVPQLETGLSTAGPAASFSPWPVLWLIPALLLFAYFVLTHLRWRRVYSKALPLVETRVSPLPWSRTLCVKTSASIETPLTYGVLRPVVLLPEALAKGQALDFVLAHEIAHIRHWDALKKWLLTLALCVHWFNPLVWMMYLLANRDMELCCDASVLRALGEGEKARYASILVEMEEARSALTPLVSHFSKNAIEERIVGIMKYRKSSLAGMLLTLALVVFTTGALATSAVTPAADAYPAVEETATSSTAPADPYENAKSYAPYAQFGLAYDMEADRLYYGGERVRYFEDLYPVGDGFYSGHCRTDEDGTVDVHAVRDLTKQKYNPDGSLDPSGELVGIAKYTQADFDQRTAALEGLKAQLIPSPNLSGTAAAPVVQYSAAGAVSAIEWWTAEEYEAWLDQQRAELPKLIGGRAWTQATGWFTWTQEKVDETLALYERILREIQAGMLHSKSINGSSEAGISGTLSPAIAVSEAFTLAEGTQGLSVQIIASDTAPAVNDTIAVGVQGTLIATESLESGAVFKDDPALTVYRTPQEIPLELPADTQFSSSEQKMKIFGTTMAGATITVETPHEALDESALATAGTFSFEAVFNTIGNNTIRIRASYPDKKDSVLEHVVYYLPPASIYTPKAWSLTADNYRELVDNIRMRQGQIYLCKGTIVKITSEKPQYAIMNTGTDGAEQLVMLENGSGTAWELGKTYRVYADVSGQYDTMPRLIGRYTYID